MKRVLLVIAPEMFQDREFTGVRDQLLAARREVVVASTEIRDCTGKFGSVVRSAIALRDVRVEDFEGIAFIGGPGAEMLASHSDALRIARAAAEAGIPLGAICIAPLILAKARVLDGKRATVWDGGSGEQSGILERYGAVYTGDTVTVSGTIVTGNGPEAAEEFGRALSAMLG